MQTNDLTCLLAPRPDDRRTAAEKFRDRAVAFTATFSAVAAVTLLVSGLTMILAGPAGAQTLPETSATGKEPTGEAMAHTCAACHGTYGELKGSNFVPLAGMNEAEFIRAMKDFRDLKRPSSIMSHIAEGYDDASIEKMAKWFSERKPLALHSTNDAAGEPAATAQKKEDAQ